SKSLWQQWGRLSKVDGVLYRQWVSDDGLHTRWQLVVPEDSRSEIIRLAHTGMTGGHLGVQKTIHQVQLRAYWPGWKRDVRKYCQQCSECTQYFRGMPPRQGPLQTFPVGEPFERIAIDLTGPHPTSRSGHVYILT